jgi:hypothetical protein
MSSIANKGVPIRLVAPTSTSLPFQHPTHLERMLQNHSRCRNGRGCGKHPPDADGPRSDGGGSLSEQGSIAQYQERPEKSSSLGTQGRLQNEGDSLEGGKADVSNRTKAWVASAAKHWQDPYASADKEYGPEACSAEDEKRERGLRDLLKQMRRRDAEEDWPFKKQMKALDEDDRKDVRRIMREDQGGHKPIERNLKRKRNSSENLKEAVAKSRKRVHDWLQQVHVGSDDMRRQALQRVP